MKKFALVLAGLFACSGLSALYNGNTSSPEMIDEGFFLCRDNFVGVKVGYQRDYVTDRRMRATSHVTHHRIDRYEYEMDQGVLTLNLTDRAEVYGTVGAMKTYFYHRPNLQGAASTINRLEYESNSKMTWGVGARFILMHWCKTALGADIKYQYSHPTIEWLASNGSVAGFPVGNSHLRFREWQLGISVSHKVDIFIPYVALKYSNNRTKVNSLPSGFLPNGQSHLRLRNRDKVGIALGCGLTTGKFFALNIEARIIDETALTLAGDIKF